MRKFLSNLIIFMLLALLDCPQLNVYSEDGDKKDDSKKVVYLTFDDAPGGEVTQKTLDILKEENVPATFFIIGEQIKGQEDIILIQSCNDASETIYLALPQRHIYVPRAGA